jgi:mRNA interferase RelE/StbE
MKMYVLEYTPNAIKDLRSLDKHTSSRIIQKVKKYSESANALVTAKALSGNMNGFYRWRVGDYRIVFSVDEKGIVTILTILNIDHRKDVYR